MSSPLTSRKPLVVALTLASILVGGFSIALYLNEDLRRYTIAQIEEITNEDGEKIKRVKIEKPEPNEQQVREISRNQERKKREELKEKAKELRETVYKIEEVVEAQKKLVEDRLTEWQQIALAADQLAEQAQDFNEHLAADDAPQNLETARPFSEELKELTEEYAEMVNQMKDSTVTPDDAKQASHSARELRNQARDFERKFKQATSQAPPEDRAKAQELQAELSEFVSNVEQHYQDMDEFSKSPYFLEKEEETPSETNPAESELAQNDEGAPTQDSEQLELDTELESAMADEATDELAQNGQLEDGEMSPLGNHLPSDEELEQLSTAELYEQIQEMTGLVDEAFAEGQAADLANRKEMSLQKAREEVYKPESQKGPDLGEALSQNQPSTREEFQQFNEALDEATSAAQQMSRTAQNRKEALTGENQQQSGQGQNGEQLEAKLNQKNQLQAQMKMLAQNGGRQNGNVQDMRALMAQNYTLGGGGNDSDGQALSMSFETAMSQSALPKTVSLNVNKTLAQAVPGRRLDMNSERQGWIFLDTWYVIGPWQRPNKNDSFDVEFPPESLVDLDATYIGKVSRFRNEPMELRWRFVQTENIRINPPDEISDAVYYGYTEVFCEAATEVTVAVASDDMAKLWVNGLVVYEDSGLSGWQIDEGFRTILLKPGYNKVLIRLDNGPAVCYFSVLMCPTESLTN
ncbi:hypothetical protein [Cerasicoccus frondis]|uniref:hypothetical protein n=1 Tax=Cerasicoccus frondis TaxID=490090 RepID=UPI0028525C4F|nr:hypothetical protein [Cerasicoccus frondis]